jgi:hypothetical protein
MRFLCREAAAGGSVWCQIWQPIQYINIVGMTKFAVSQYKRVSRAEVAYSWRGCGGSAPPPPPPQQSSPLSYLSTV